MVSGARERRLLDGPKYGAEGLTDLALGAGTSSAGLARSRGAGYSTSKGFAMSYRSRVVISLPWFERMRRALGRMM